MNPADLLLWTWALVIFSVCWDHATYERRQTAWEKAHPGSTYIRHYRRFEKQSKRARKLSGEL